MAPDLFQMDKTLTCSFSGHRKSMCRSNRYSKHSNCSPLQSIDVECKAHFNQRLNNVVLHHIIFYRCSSSYFRSFLVVLGQTEISLLVCGVFPNPREMGNLESRCICTENMALHKENNHKASFVRDSVS